MEETDTPKCWKNLRKPSGSRAKFTDGEPANEIESISFNLLPVIRIRTRAAVPVIIVKQPSRALPFSLEMTRSIIVDDTSTDVSYIGTSWFADVGSLDAVGNFGPPFLSTSHGTNSTASFALNFTGRSYIDSSYIPIKLSP